MKDEWKVGRVIARPFIGEDASTLKELLEDMTMLYHHLRIQP